MDSLIKGIWIACFVVVLISILRTLISCLWEANAGPLKAKAIELEVRKEHLRLLEERDKVEYESGEWFVLTGQIKKNQSRLDHVIAQLVERRVKI